MIKVYQLRKKQNSYEVTLYYKGVKVRVAFTGGNVYNGTLPVFRTDNLFKMKAVEASQLFKDKEVVLLRTTGEESDNKQNTVQKARKAFVKKDAAPAPKKAAKDAPKTSKPAPKPEEPVAPEVTEPVEDEGPKEIIFDNLGEAISYIAQNYQMEVRSQKEARDVLKAHGIKPVIKQG